MKKLLAILLTIILSFGLLAGCGGDSSDGGSSTETQKNTTEADDEKDDQDSEKDADVNVDTDALAENIKQLYARCVEYHNGTTQMINDGIELGFEFDESLVAEINALADELTELGEMDLNTYTEDEMLTLEANLDESLVSFKEANDSIAKVFTDAGYETTTN